MAIGYSDNIRSQVVQICTPELLHQTLKSNRVKTVCAQLADALESKLRGEICNDDYEEMKIREDLEDDLKEYVDEIISIHHN